MPKGQEKEKKPVRILLDIHALPAATDAEALAAAAGNVANLLEDAGVFGQRGPAPAHVFRLADKGRRPDHA